MIPERTAAKNLMANWNPEQSLSADDTVIELKEAGKDFLPGNAGQTPL
jgi:hypothetical protein